MAEHRNRSARRAILGHDADGAFVEVQPPASTDLGWDDETTAVDIVMPMAELIGSAR